MIVNCVYKQTTISISLSETSMKIESIKKGLINSLTDIINSKRMESNPSATKISYNGTTLTCSIGVKNFENDIKRLCEPKLKIKLFSKVSGAIKEKKDDELIKVDLNSSNKEKPEFNFNLSLCNIIPDCNKQSYNVESKKIEEIIPLCTGGKIPLKKIETKPNRSGFEDFLQGQEEQRALLNALMSLRVNNDPGSRTEILNRMILPILAGGGSGSLGGLGGSNFQINFGRPTVSSSSSTQHSETIIRPAVQPNQDFINQLVEMGFPEDRSRTVLIATRNNIEAAVEMLANDEDIGLDGEGGQNSQNQGNSQSQNDNYLVDVEYEEDDIHDD